MRPDLLRKSDSRALEAGARRVRDRRFGEKWTRAQALKNALIRGAAYALLFIVDRLPQAWLLVAGSLAGRIAHGVLGGTRRRTQLRIAETISGRDVEDLTRTCFENAGRNFAICLLLRRPRVRAASFVALSQVSKGTLDRALASGRGAIVVSAHIGPFETIPAVLVEHGFSPSIVVRESYDAELDRVADAHRRARGVGVIHRGDDHAALRVARALRNGRPVGILPDVGSRGVATTRARFLGRAVAFPVGVERLATRLQCPVLLGTLARPADGLTWFELRLEALDGEMGEAGESLTQRVAGALTWAILRCPEHWLWMAPAHVAIADDSRSSLFSGVIPSSELGNA